MTTDHGTDDSSAEDHGPERLTDGDRVAAVWNLPFQRNVNFTGRGRMLADLARAYRPR